MTLINDLDIRRGCQGLRTDCQDLRAEPDFFLGERWATLSAGDLDTCPQARQ
jgi:hypothetical protein